MTTLWFALVLFFANTMQMITGFAGNLLAMPASIQLIGYDSARVTINIVTLAACSILCIRQRQYIRISTLSHLLIILMGAMILTLWIRPLLPYAWMAHAYGIFLIILGVKKLWYPANKTLSNFKIVVMTMLAGMIHTLFLSGGALLALVLFQLLPKKEEFRATISFAWVVLDGLLIFSHIQEGLYTPMNVFYIGCSMIPCFASIAAGVWLYQKVNASHFAKLTYLLVCFSGISMLMS